MNIEKQINKIFGENEKIIENSQPDSILLDDEHIEVIAKKVALKYAYANEHSYGLYVKAIIEGMKIGRSVMSKNIT